MEIMKPVARRYNNDFSLRSIQKPYSPGTAVRQKSSSPCFVDREVEGYSFYGNKKRFGHIGRNDKSDAFRHCFWSAVLVREIGYQNALQFTNAHESDPKNPPAEKAMDLYNNSIGLSIGRAGGNNTYLSGRCMVALLSGQLKVIKK